MAEPTPSEHKAATDKHFLWDMILTGGGFVFTLAALTLTIFLMIQDDRKIENIEKMVENIDELLRIARSNSKYHTIK